MPSYEQHASFVHAPVRDRAQSTFHEVAILRIPAAEVWRFQVVMINMSFFFFDSRPPTKDYELQYEAASDDPPCNGCLWPSASASASS